ncbi:MAG TPA: pyridoxal phosphate-dependent aminotransferase [Ktedonobacterales bacterium]
MVHIPARRHTHSEPRTPAKVSFPDLMAALDGYLRDTGQQPMMLGGWDVEDAAIHPPATLEARLCSIVERPHRYTYTKDFLHARERAAQIFARSMSFDGRPLQPENVSILHNSTQGLLLALAALKEQDIRRVVVATPVYFAAIETCRLLGIDAVLVPAAEYLTGTLDLDRLLSELRVPHSALLLTNPAYSLGVQHPPESLSSLFAALPRETWVLLDESRLGLHWHDPSPWYSASFPERTLVLRSPSKVFFTNGLKTSLLFGPSTVLRSIERLADVLVGSAPGNAEFVALAYLDAWNDWEAEARMRQHGPFQAWRAQVVAQLRANLGRIQPDLDQYGLLCSPIDSGPHLLAALPHAHEHRVDPIELARHEGVHVMMSSHFFHESDAWSGFRINLCGDAACTRAALLHVLDRLYPEIRINVHAAEPFTSGR